MKEKRLLYNGIITPDGTKLASYHTHDYKAHVDKVTGKTYGVDGGIASGYIRYIGDVDPDCEIILVYSDDDISDIREYFSWGTYGPNGDQPLKFVLLKEMSKDHINNIINDALHTPLEDIFKRELEYRKINNLE